MKHYYARHKNGMYYEVTQEQLMENHSIERIFDLFYMGIITEEERDSALEDEGVYLRWFTLVDMNNCEPIGVFKYERWALLYAKHVLKERYTEVFPLPEVRYTLTKEFEDFKVPEDTDVVMF